MTEHRLLDGVRRFRETEPAQSRELHRRLAAEGQSPDVLFVCCSDSRLVPNALTATGPGELFTVRTVGNIIAPPGTPAPDATLAAVEFAVAVLGVSDIVVCGHLGCGAMAALYDAPSGADLDHLRGWVDHARPAALPADEAADMDVAQRDLLTVRRGVLLSLQRLASHPRVAAGVAAGTLALHGWVYDLAAGDVTVHDDERGEFLPR